MFWNHWASQCGKVAQNSKNSWRGTLLKPAFALLWSLLLLGDTFNRIYIKLYKIGHFLPNIFWIRTKIWVLLTKAILQFHILKYIPHKVDVTLIYPLIKYSHSLDWNISQGTSLNAFKANFHILKPFGFWNIRRRWDGAMSLGSQYLISTFVHTTIRKIKIF